MAIPYILHIDTSGISGTALLAAGGQIIAVRRSMEEREHAGTINGMIGEVLDEAGIVLDEVGAIAVCSGPGSYTGLRIGMATAKGLCYALDKPLITHNKLELLADNKKGSTLLVLLPARAGEYFMALYDGDGNAIIEPQHSYRADVMQVLKNDKKIAIAGIAEDDLIAELNENHEYLKKMDIDEKLWAAAAMMQYNKRVFQNVESAEPMYLKQVFIHKKTE